MSDLKQAAQQALVTLENVNPSLVCEMAHHSKKDQHGIGQKCPLEIRHLETITALKEVLAQQPVQEPVACRFCHDKKGCWTWQCYSCGEIDDVQKPAPPAAQRPWQGLTAEEILDLFDSSNVYGSKWIEFARTVETKLKERNDDDHRTVQAHT